MDLDNTQLHPNWRALATVDFPRKRFVRGIELQSKQETKYVTHNNLQEEQNGEAAKNFYQNLTKNSISRSRLPCQTATPKQRYLQKFDCNKFFRLATMNKCNELALIDYQGDDINMRDTFGWTALMMAACEGALDAVKTLIHLGADKNLKESTGRTALDFAMTKGFNHIANILRTTCSTPSAEQKLICENVSNETFYCTTCEQTLTNTNKLQHETSTVHQFNCKPSFENKLQKFNISTKNRGLQLMVKQGWDKESGLGPTQTGRLYPVKTVIRKKRTGLGTKQEPARVTHFGAYDKQAIKHNESSVLPNKKKRSRSDIRSEKQREWKRERRLRKELS
ncbi:G patch domain and ankyrin repeat-containing protein 1 homolog [Ceratitis capitata]|uniref:(Mediterranean fruit fly) hypothetical protein n=1 Tax=Ceratitis capitata TaxID=7213 RepID=W8BNI0_CERCA|nr:G patch domain and ankyrin repeat-containing protein 1 homolog [Ceratitis capitata]CAD7014270.1 unnamed protein product [Ceratitis capitata]